MKGLKMIRKRKGFTLQQVEAITGVDLNTISRYERGVIEPSSKTALKIANGLGVSVDELLNGPEEAAWKLEVKILNDFEREEIDMTKGTCVSDLELTRDGAALRLAGKYEVFEDDGKFEGLISQLRAAREMVIENGRRMMALNAATA